MKKIIVIFAVFILVLGIVFYIKSSGSAGTPGRVPSSFLPSVDLPLLAPSFPPPATKDRPVYVVPSPSISFPSSLPQYAVGTSEQKTVAQALAAALKFTNAPTSFSNTNGTYYVWNERSASFSAGGTPIEANYSSGVAVSDTIQAPARDFDAEAKKILALLGLPQKPYELSPGVPTYFTVSGSDLRETNSPNPATVIQVSYQLLLDNRPFFTGHPGEPSISIRFNNKKEVVSAVFTVPPPIGVLKESAPVVSIQEGIARLQKNEGVLVSLYSPGSNDFTAPQYTISQGTVTETVLGYFWGKGQPALVPSYFFTGKTTDTERGTSLIFSTIVSALPSK